MIGGRPGRVGRGRILVRRGSRTGRGKKKEMCRGRDAVPDQRRCTKVMSLIVELGRPREERGKGEVRKGEFESSPSRVQNCVEKELGELGTWNRGQLAREGYRKGNCR